MVNQTTTAKSAPRPAPAADNDESEKYGVCDDSNCGRTDDCTRHIALRVVHLFAGTVLQFKTDELENDYRQNNAYNQAKVGRNQVGGVEVRAFGLTADNESQ